MLCHRPNDYRSLVLCGLHRTCTDLDHLGSVAHSHFAIGTQRNSSKNYIMRFEVSQMSLLARSLPKRKTEQEG